VIFKNKHKLLKTDRLDEIKSDGKKIDYKLIMYSSNKIRIFAKSGVDQCSF